MLVRRTSGDAQHIIFLYLGGDFLLFDLFPHRIVTLHEWKGRQPELRVLGALLLKMTWPDCCFEHNCPKSRSSVSAVCTPSLSSQPHTGMFRISHEHLIVWVRKFKKMFHLHHLSNSQYLKAIAMPLLVSLDGVLYPFARQTWNVADATERLHHPTGVHLIPLANLSGATIICMQSF